MTQKEKRYILILMTAMFFLGVSASDIYIASLPQMVQDFKTTPSHVNLTLSSYTFGVAVAVLFVGEISNRFGRRITLLSGVACFSLASLLIAIVPVLNLVIMLRVLQAFGCSFIMLITRLVLKDCMTEHEQINANGIILTTLTISPAIAPVIGASLAHWFGWQSCFVFSGVIGLILVFLGIKYLPETNTMPLSKFAPLSYYWKIYCQILKNRVFIVLTLLYASGVGAYFTFIGISSYLYINSWHFTPETYALMYLWMSAAYLAGNQIMLFLNRRRVSPVKIMQFGIYATLLGTLVMLLGSLFNNSMLLVGLVTAGVVGMRASNALINPPTQIRIMSAFPHSSAQALGLNMSMGLLVMSLSITLVSFFAATPLVGLLIVSSLFVAICVLTFYFNRKFLV